MANATDTDLQAFRTRGGKLLMTYGWADPILQPLMGVQLLRAGRRANGPERADFFRLFMVPGMAHCGGGIGPDQNDAVTAVIDWVEKGKAPDVDRREEDRERRRRRARGRCALIRRSRATRGRAASTTPRASSAGCREPVGASAEALREITAVLIDKAPYRFIDIFGSDTMTLLPVNVG